MRWLLALLLLSGCTHQARLIDVARRSYELGCVDRGNGSVTDSYTCYHSSKKFERELREAWRP